MALVPVYEAPVLPAGTRLSRGQVEVVARCQGHDLVARFQAEPALDLAGEAARLLDHCALFPQNRLPWGWSEVALRSHRGRWLLCEPDFAGDFGQRLVPSVTRTLQAAMEAQDLQRKLQVEPTPCSWRDRILLSLGALDRKHYMLHRHSRARNGQSGWYVGPVKPADIARNADFEHVPSAWLAARHFHLIPYLALPEGSLAIFERKRLVELRTER